MRNAFSFFASRLLEQKYARMVKMAAGIPAYGANTATTQSAHATAVNINESEPCTLADKSNIIVVVYVFTSASLPAASSWPGIAR
jgi:hypothetical protein